MEKGTETSYLKIKGFERGTPPLRSEVLSSPFLSPSRGSTERPYFSLGDSYVKMRYANVKSAGDPHLTRETDSIDG